MNKINNKLILTLAILAFVFGLSSPAEAYTVTVDSGVSQNSFYNSYSYPTQYNNTPIVYNTPVYYTTTPVNTGPRVIPGCEGRNTGFSTVTGESCAENYVNTSTTTTTVKKTTSSSAVVKNTSDSDSFGGLTANALFGSNSFMPSGLIQWIFFILLILAIIFLWRYVHGEEKYMAEPMKHA